MKKSTSLSAFAAMLCTATMKIKFIIAIIALQSAIINPQSKMLFAQSYQWAKNIGGTSGDEGYSIAVDKLKITIFAT